MLQSLVAFYQGTSIAPPTSDGDGDGDGEAENINDGSEAAAAAAEGPSSSNRTLLIYSKQMSLSLREDEYCASRPPDLPDMTVTKMTHDVGSVPLPLHNAIEEGAPMEVIQLLIKEYPDAAKEKSKYGLLPLHTAVI